MIRLSQVVRALGAVSEVEFFSLLDERRSVSAMTVPVRLARSTTAPYPTIANGALWRPRWLLDRALPAEVAMRSLDGRGRRALRAWASDQYDLVWFSTAAVFEWMGRPRLGPTVVDIDNLEHESVRRRLAVRTRPPAAGVRTRLRDLASEQQLRLDAGSWRRFQASVAASVDRVVLCSDLDVARSRLPNAVVVPNTYERPAEPAGREEVLSPPVVLFQGRLNYPPNVDAASYLVQEVAPLIWERVPEAQIRLVGRPTPGVKRLHSPPHVVVAGKVPDIARELSEAALVVVPLRFGSGTRLKILESFAHRVPVVSTRFGAEGLDVDDGVHLLLADGAGSLAEACARLIFDRALRKRVVDAAQALHRERYDLPVAEERVCSLARELAPASARPAASWR